MHACRCGKITLETYIFQFHLWLSDDAGTLVYWVGGAPGSFPLINFVLASVVYVAVSWWFFRLTNTLSDVFIPNDADTAAVVKRVLMAVAVSVNRFAPCFAPSACADETVCVWYVLCGGAII